MKEVGRHVKVLYTPHARNTRGNGLWGTDTATSKRSSRPQESSVHPARLRTGSDQFSAPEQMRNRAAQIVRESVPLIGYLIVLHSAVVWQKLPNQPQGKLILCGLI